MYDNLSFGGWLKRRRKELDFTREELAKQVGCSTIMIYKIEASRRRPSKQIAALLARELKIPPQELDNFIKFARQSDAPNTTSDSTTKGIFPSITPLIGREAELITLEDMLLVDRKNIITLVGIPGVGKTSLAAQLLRNVEDQFDDESYFVSLVSIHEPDAVAPTIARCLGLQEVAGQSHLEQIKRFFTNRVSLLVLDNFEHLLKSKSLITELSEACPRLHIIITTRVALKLPNETVFRVKTLKTPDLKHVVHFTQLLDYSSVDLFVHHARAAKPLFALTDENALAVAQICTRLEGIPLAIVLAAARIKMFSPESLYPHLDKRLSSVTARYGSHETLRDALAWSYDLLSLNEQQLFSKLAVFRHGGTFEAIEKVCRENDEDVLGSLETLIDHNLVQETQDEADQTRFYMLETMREYASEKLDQVSAYQVDEIKRAHAEYFLSVAEQAEPRLRTKDQLIWLARLDADQDNFEAALDWSLQADAEINLRLAGALGWFWYIRGRLRRGTYWLKLATQNIQNAPLRFRANAYFYISAIASVTGDSQWGFEASEEAVRLFRILQDDRMVGQALVGHVTSHLSLGLWDKINALLSEGMELAEKANDKHTLAAYGIHIAFIQPDNVIRANAIEAQLPIIRETGDLWLLNLSLVELGHTYIHLGNYQRAEEIIREALKSIRKISDIRVEGWALGILGEAQFYLGDMAAASQMIIEGLRISRDVSDKEASAIHLTQLAMVFHAAGHSEFAAHLLGNVSNLGNRGNQLGRDVHISRYNKILEQVREHLSPNAFNASWQAGKTMILEQTIEYALSYAAVVDNLF